MVLFLTLLQYLRVSVVNKSELESILAAKR